MLHNFVRLSRLTLAVALLYVWLISTGTQVIRDGLRHLVDRKRSPGLEHFPNRLAHHRKVGCQCCLQFVFLGVSTDDGKLSGD